MYGNTANLGITYRDWAEIRPTSKLLARLSAILYHPEHFNHSSLTVNSILNSEESHRGSAAAKLFLTSPSERNLTPFPLT